MAFLRIVELDGAWVQGFRAMLIEDEGAKETADALVLEVPDDFAFEAFHGIEKFNPNALPFDQEFADVVAWLRAYSGTFEFYVSLKMQLAAKGKLSPKQIDSVRRAIARDEQKAIERVSQVFTLDAGDVLRVSKWLAHELARKAGLARPHFVVEVVRVEAETPKAYKLDVRLSAQRTSVCSICGIKLTNAESVTNGIGPICAEKVGVGYSGASLEELAEKLKTTAVVNTWVPKGAIKERVTK